MRSFYHFLRRLSSVVIGLVFFISGMLKIMDPAGATLIVEDYLQFFHLGWLWPLRRVIGVAIPLAEALTGAALISGVWRKAVALVTSVMTIAFTAISVVLVLRNPEMDCGCFGEAIHLTHWQTLIKNIILCVLCIFTFIPISSMYAFRKRKIVSFSLGSALIILFCVYSQQALPLVDFTRLAPGTHLYDPMSDEQAGELLEMRDGMDEYCGDMLLSGKHMIISVHDPRKMSGDDWEYARKAVAFCLDSGVDPILLTSIYDDGALDLFPYMYFADRRDILTLNRSNGGLTYISDGEIIRKWACHHSGSREKMEAALSANTSAVRTSAVSSGRVRIEGLSLVILVLLLLI